jgi:hypothetical protein
MRKIQVQKAFDEFCGGWLLPANMLVCGGAKNPLVHFDVSGVQFTYYPGENRVLKHQARDNLKFDNAKSVLDFVKKMEAMKAQDPHSRGRYD